MYYKKALEEEESSRQKEKSPFPTGKNHASLPEMLSNQVFRSLWRYSSRGSIGPKQNF